MNNFKKSMTMKKIYILGLAALMSPEVLFAGSLTQLEGSFKTGPAII